MHHHDRVRIGTSLWVTPYSVTPFPCRPGDRDAPREAGSTRGAGRVKRVQRVQENDRRRTPGTTEREWSTPNCRRVTESHNLGAPSPLRGTLTVQRSAHIHAFAL